MKVEFPNKAIRGLSTQERLAQQVEEFSKAARLESWNSFVEQLPCPPDVYPAMVTMRPELLALATRRPLDAVECDALYKLLAGLMQTNEALRQHAKQVAQLTTSLAGMIRGAVTMAERIDHFANFRSPQSEE